MTGKDAVGEEELYAKTDNITGTIRQKGGGKPILVILAIILIVAAAAAIALKAGTLLSHGESTDKTAYLSEADMKTQQEVKSLTGHDWESFLKSRGEAANTAAILLLAQEIGELQTNFDFVNRSAGISAQEMGIAQLPFTDATGNLAKAAENAKKANELFYAKGLTAGQERAKRLAMLAQFFGEGYKLPGSEMQPEEAELLGQALGFRPDSYEEAAKLIIINHNMLAR